IAVALESTVSTFVYPSVVFVYPDRGDEWIDANTPPAPSILLQSTLTAESEVERFTRSGKRGIVLRMGGFYGPTTSTTQYMWRMTRYRVAMMGGRGQAYQAVVWVDDAALAVVDGLLKASAGIYDIVDDEPLQRRELAAALADVTGRRWLVRPPRF